MTHNAVISSLLRYALAATGSSLPPDLTRRVKPQIVGTARPRGGGPSSGARNECFQFAAGATTVFNLYVRH